jgi:hypothetical protein
MTETVTLYRGFKERPRFKCPGLEARLQKLCQEVAAVGGGLNELTQLGPKHMAERVQLQMLLFNPQHFTDDRNVALNYAGKNGFLLAIKLTRDEAIRHMVMGQQMKAYLGGASTTNFSFSPDELAENLNQWQATILDIAENTTF